VKTRKAQRHAQLTAAGVEARERELNDVVVLAASRRSQTNGAPVGPNGGVEA
jgi:hypothetical protein